MPLTPTERRNLAANTQATPAPYVRYVILQRNSRCTAPKAEHRAGADFTSPPTCGKCSIRICRNPIATQQAIAVARQGAEDYAAEMRRQPLSNPKVKTSEEIRAAALKAARLGKPELSGTSTYREANTGRAGTAELDQDEVVAAYAAVTQEETRNYSEVLAAHYEGTKLVADLQYSTRGVRAEGALDCPEYEPDPLHNTEPERPRNYFFQPALSIEAYREAKAKADTYAKVAALGALDRTRSQWVSIDGEEPQFVERGSAGSTPSYYWLTLSTDLHGEVEAECKYCHRKWAERNARLVLTHTERKMEALTAMLVHYYECRAIAHFRRTAQRKVGVEAWSRWVAPEEVPPLLLASEAKPESAYC